MPLLMVKIRNLHANVEKPHLRQSIHNWCLCLKMLNLVQNI